MEEIQRTRQTKRLLDLLCGLIFLLWKTYDKILSEAESGL